MTRDVVAATASNAKRGLYLTPDMSFCAGFIVPFLLEHSVDRLHAKQPLTEVFSPWADRVQDTYLAWKSLTRLSDQSKARLGEITMVAADLASTYRQIERAMVAAVDTALAIHFRTIGAEDHAEYRRVIPRELEDMQIAAIEQVDVIIMHRILQAEPWGSWMERLRAQHQRTEKVLRTSEDLADRLRDGIIEIIETITRDTRKVQIRQYRENQLAHKSIRRSVKMYERLGTMSNLRLFLNSHQADTALVIPGQQYDYHLVMRRNSLIPGTIMCDTKMSPVATAVYNKAGDRLCEVCLYYEDTPVLDYVMAMGLNVSNCETELDILRAGCVIDTPRGFYDDPVLPDLKELSDPVDAPMLIDNIFNHSHTLPMTSQEMLKRSAMREHAQPLAHQAFTGVMCLSKNYLPLMRGCSEYSVWSYIDSEDEALSRLRMAQQACADGLF